MKTRRLTTAGAALLVAAGAVLAPVAAHAETNHDHYGYQGADYAYSYKSSLKMQVADEEGDGRWVYSDYYLSGSSSKHQLNNKSGYGTDVYRSVSSKPYKLRAVEAIPVLPNAYGHWDYPDDYTF